MPPEGRPAAAFPPCRAVAGPGLRSLLREQKRRVQRESHNSRGGPACRVGDWRTLERRLRLSRGITLLAALGPPAHGEIHNTARDNIQYAVCDVYHGIGAREEPVQAKRARGQEDERG